MDAEGELPLRSSHGLSRIHCHGRRPGEQGSPGHSAAAHAHLPGLSLWRFAPTVEQPCRIVIDELWEGLRPPHTVVMHGGACPAPSACIVPSASRGGDGNVTHPMHRQSAGAVSRRYAMAGLALGAGTLI